MPTINNNGTAKAITDDLDAFMETSVPYGFPSYIASSSDAVGKEDGIDLKCTCPYQKPHPPCRFMHLGHAEYSPAPTPI
jgi:hypothetical protein